MESGDQQAVPQYAAGQLRIIIAALQLFADAGFEGTTTRQISAAARVTPGLITHHFGSKAGLLKAVEDYVVQGIAEAVDVDDSEVPRLVAAGVDVATILDQQIYKYLQDRPEAVAYLRRAILLRSQPDSAELMNRITDIARRQVKLMRRHELASTERDEEQQVFDLLVRHLGSLFMIPLVDKLSAEIGVEAPEVGLAPTAERGARQVRQSPHLD